jgi:hypothetical protein
MSEIRASSLMLEDLSKLLLGHLSISFSVFRVRPVLFKNILILSVWLF